MEDFMLEDYYVKPSTVDRVRASWLAPQIESYLEWLESHRYSRLVVYRRLPLLFHFAEFVQKKGCKDVASCKAYIKEFVSQWLEQHGAKAKSAVAVRKHTIDAGITFRSPQKRGLHSLRHTLATRLLEKGTPFPTIAEILGQTSLESTRIYAKANVEALRGVALDPEEVNHAS
jgi:integrase